MLVDGNRRSLDVERGWGLFAVAMMGDYGRPVLDPTTVFDESGPLEPPLTDEVLRTVEAQLGRRLPAAYVALARQHNGGYFARDAHPAPRRTTWSNDHVGVVSLAAIGRTAGFSLCGEQGSAFWVAEWGYPDIGVYIADCPSAGHDMIALDYRRPGEPAVVHIDQEWDYQITVLAPDFESFVKGLTDELDYDELDKDR
jgi:hypothetical protein